MGLSINSVKWLEVRTCRCSKMLMLLNRPVGKTAEECIPDRVWRCIMVQPSALACIREGRCFLFVGQGVQKFGARCG
jgi:hypothetical protein